MLLPIFMLISSSAGQTLSVNYNASSLCAGPPKKITYEKLTPCTPYNNCPGMEPYGAQKITCSPSDSDLVNIFNAQGTGYGVTVQYSDDSCTLIANASAELTTPIGGNPLIGKCQFNTLGLRQALLATPISSLLPGGSAGDPGMGSGAATLSASLALLVACLSS